MVPVTRRSHDRALPDAVHGLGGRDTAGLKDRGDDIDDVAELFAKRTLVLDPRRPRDRHVLPDAAELRSVLLEPAERCIESPGPARRHVVVRLLRAPDVIPLHLILDWNADAIEECNFIRSARGTTLRAGTVVTVDVDDERVVQLAHVIDSLNDAPDFTVIVGCISGEDFHLPDVEFLLIGRAVIPVLDEILWPRLHLRVRRDHTQSLLVFKNLLTNLVPAFVEEMQVADLLYPFLRWMMRRMCGIGCRCVMILAKPGRGVTVILKHPPDGGLVLGDDAVVTGEARGLLGTPNPESSVIISSTLGAFFGGTMRGAHHGFDCRASFLITPPNFASGAGSCLPSMEVVAPREPGVPVICWAWVVAGAENNAVTINTPDATSFFAFLVLSGLSKLKRNSIPDRKFAVYFVEVAPCV